jgi:predicted nucleotidyltransferase
MLVGMDGIVLDRLHRVYGPQTAGEIHRRAKAGSLSGIRLSLERLAAQGIVIPQAVGNVIGYRVNEEHVVYPAIKAALENYHPYELLRERLRQTLEEVFPVSPLSPGPSLAIYGSVARREATAESDVDLLLVLPDAVAPTSQMVENLTAELHGRVLRWTGNRAHVYLIARTQLGDAYKGEDPITRSWAQDADTVAGPDVRKLMLDGAIS